MATRGTHQFEVQTNGNLVDNPENIECARRLFRDGAMIAGRWGPGNPGDFDNGSWHSLCHLAAAAGVSVLDNNRYLWVGLTHSDSEDRYSATVSTRQADGIVHTVELDSPAGKALLAHATLLGYVEGTSVGHISARNVQDPPTAFNNWPRQNFNQPVGSNADGGTVWEHWCTTRDLRPSSPVGDSVLRAYVGLVSTLGGQFVASVIRGRRTYDHPIQLCAMVKAGFIAREDALLDMMPFKIPSAEDRLFQEARPADSLKAVESLAWTPAGGRRYFMFERRIGSWSKKSNVEADLRRFGL